MRILDVRASHSVGASYCTDQVALQRGARDGLFIVGPAVLPGFREPREPAEVVSIHYQMVHAPTIGDVADVVQTVVDLKKRGVKVYLAGSATGTHGSATTLIHLTPATSPDLVL